jgi:hypothetical protein
LSDAAAVAAGARRSSAANMALVRLFLLAGALAAAANDYEGVACMTNDDCDFPHGACESRWNGAGKCVVDSPSWHRADKPHQDCASLSDRRFFPRPRASRARGERCIPTRQVDSQEAGDEA